MRAYTVFITLALLALGTVVDARPGNLPVKLPVETSSSSTTSTSTTDAARQTDPAHRGEIHPPNLPPAPVNPAAEKAETTTSSTTATATTTTATATSTTSSSADGAQPTPNAPQLPAPLGNLSGKASGQRGTKEINDTLDKVTGRREEENPEEYKVLL